MSRTIDETIKVERMLWKKEADTKNKKKVKIKIPSHLVGFVKDCENKGFVQMTLCSSAANDLFEILYYGDLFQVKGEEQPYIVNTQVAPMKIVAKDIATGEEILVFDGGKHGYDNMFCDEYRTEQIENRALKQYEIPSSKLILKIGYGIDYESEKEDYDIDKDENVLLINGDKMPWKDVKRNGFDYIALYYVNTNGKVIQFLDCELA